MYDIDEEKNQQLCFQMCALNGKGGGAQGSGGLGGRTTPPDLCHGYHTQLSSAHEVMRSRVFRKACKHVVRATKVKNYPSFKYFSYSDYFYLHEFK